MSIEVKLGDVFYRVEPTDSRVYHRVCRVCKGERKLTVNDITFECPMCRKEGEALRVNGFFVRRYRLFSIEHYISDYDWKYEGEAPRVRYEIYHKSGKGHHSYSSTHTTRKVEPYVFSGKSPYFNQPNPNEHSVANCLYSDYKLAVEVAERLNQMQVDKVRAYNEANNTDYELPVFEIEHDKKSN